MDNRISPVIHDFIKLKSSNNELDFLQFKDWFDKKENQSSDWTIIARNIDRRTESLFTISCLIESNEDNLKTFLSNSEWFINTNFGIPQKYRIPYEGEKYDDGLVAEKDGVIYSPFTFFREYSNYIPSHFQVIEHILLYYNCFWVEKNNEFQSIDEDGEVKTIIRRIKDNNQEIFMIDTFTLRDYLAVKGAYLARFHDHKRRSSIDISTYLSEEAETYICQSDNYYFDLDLRTDIQFDEIKSTSRLLGKDVIKPYISPKSNELFRKKTDSQYLDFIITRDEDGQEICSTCNPDILSNNFEDRGTPHFLTPVYFKKELLQKYYSEPTRYETSDFSVSCLCLWSIQIDITKENLIQVYLGDIGQRLPYKEQLHWKQFNVVPKGTISEYRFKNDFLVESSFPEMSDAPIAYFKETFEKLQDAFMLHYNDSIFLELSPNDRHLYTTIHIPLTEEWKEFDEQILCLAKTTIDSINCSLLETITNKKIGDLDANGKKIKGGLALLNEYILTIVSDNISADFLITPFNAIQAIRSSSVAHRKGKEFEKSLSKYKLEKLSNVGKFKKVVIDVVKSMEEITQCIK